MTKQGNGRLTASLLVLIAFAAAAMARAQQPSSPGQAGQVRAKQEKRAQQQNETSGQTIVQDQAFDQETMRETQRNFMDLMRSHPRFWTAIQVDPSLLSNQEYVNRDPVIGSFLARHPEVARDPDYFVGSNRLPYFRMIDREPSQWDRVLNIIGPFLVFVIILGALLWVLKVMLENRRWSRMTKIQTDLHTKLLEKFTSNQELFAYMETDAGRRFLESAPVIADLGQGTRLSAPFGRILWSAQLGLVLALAGIGLLIIRSHVPDGEPPLLVLGTLGLTIGCGFIIAAGISYGLSTRLGLFDRQVPATGKLGLGETPKSVT